MHKPVHLISSLLAFALVLLIVAGCGSSSGVAQIEGASNSSISRATLNHWMQAMVGGDFRQNIGTRGPTGLVSEPANYARCASAVKLISPKTFYNQVKLSQSEISLKCHQLYHSIKAQALSYLITAQWAIAEGEEHAIKVSNAEVLAEFKRYRTVPYPSEAELHQYLTDRQWTLSDLLYQLKRNILVSRLLPKLEAKVKQAGGGQHTFARLAEAHQQGMIARTKCSAGYVVPNCKEYHGPPVVPPAPDVILERMVQGRST